jgi:hypothetical protein
MHYTSFHLFTRVFVFAIINLGKDETPYNDFTNMILPLLT